MSDRGIGTAVRTVLYGHGLRIYVIFGNQLHAVMATRTSRVNFRSIVKLYFVYLFFFIIKK